ncbi:MAG: oligosaccharide flippase family protein [Saprospiraceae bacterium]|nr:oligosaccharide flippase family protein [Saprospiraceae bacterium]
MMFKKIGLQLGNIKNNRDYRRVLINFLSLSLIQVSNYLIPLITFPYLVRTLGLEMYGLVSFGQNIFSYFEQILTYSFILTAPKDISQANGSKEDISRIFHRVFFSKIALFVLCLCLVLVLTWTIPRFYEIKALMGAGLLILLANILQFDWFFQGIQEMKNITLLNLSARFLSIALLFLTVHSSTDIVAALVFLPISNIAVGIIALILIYRKYRLPFTPPLGKESFGQYSAIFDELKKGFQIFISQFLVRFYSADVNITILGFLSNNLTLGIYTFANRIFALAAAATSPLSTALYPHLAKLYVEDPNQYRRQFRTILGYLLAAFIVLGLGLFVSADFITTFLAGQHTPQSSLILRILSVALIFAPFGAFYTQAFVILGKEKTLLTTIFICIAVNAISLTISYHYFGVLGLAMTNAIVWFVLFLIPLFHFKKWQVL